jgi:hypothetical protein
MGLAPGERQLDSEYRQRTGPATNIINFRSSDVPDNFRAQALRPVAAATRREQP